MFGVGPIEILILALLFLWLLPLVPLVFFLLTVRGALLACATESRRMEPDLVWLQLIPFFGLVWQFFVVTAVADSLEAEYRRRGLPAGPDPGRSLGLAMCVLSVCGIVPFVGVLTLPASLVCLVLYWMRIAAAKNHLVAGA